MTTLEYVEALRGAMVNADFILPGRLCAPRSQWRRIVDEVAASHNVAADDVLERVKRHKVAHARFHVWQRMRFDLSMAYELIAELFGVDHTSVIYGVRRWAELEKKGKINGLRIC